MRFVIGLLALFAVSSTSANAGGMVQHLYASDYGSFGPNSLKLVDPNQFKIDWVKIETNAYYSQGYAILGEPGDLVHFDVDAYAGSDLDAFGYSNSGSFVLDDDLVFKSISASGRRLTLLTGSQVNMFYGTMPLEVWAWSLGTSNIYGAYSDPLYHAGGGYVDQKVIYKLTPFVPEPATWATMLAGFAVTGSVLRRRQPRNAAAV